MHAGAVMPALRDVSFRLEAGGVLLVVGPSGSGKSTLARAIAGLIPDEIPGELSGRLLVGDTDMPRASRAAAAHRVGLVLQDPASGLVLEAVEDDVAFGLESLGWSLEAMCERVPVALSAMGLGGFERRSTARLSGGEQQRVALAGALAPDPGVLVLDEPTANLDPAGTAAVFEGLASLRVARRTTIVLIEHRVERAWPLADLVLALGGDGTPLDLGTPDQVLARSAARLATAGIWLPADRRPRPAPPGRRHAMPAGPPVLQVRDVHARADGGGRRDADAVLHGVSLEILAGERVVVVGPNGGGKSTLCRVAAGLVAPTGGSVRLGGADPARLPAAALATRVGYAPQDPELGFLADSVAEEIALGLGPVGRAGGRGLLERIGLPLERFGARSPYRLSGGEQRRLSLATALVRRPGLLVLDEPTFGQDRRGHEAVVEILEEAADRGTAVLAASHDERLVADLADRRIELTEGWLEVVP